jgi:beta-lactamase regulating signal transducer with metallopeptidase domain
VNGSLLGLGELAALAYLTFALGIAGTCVVLYPLLRKRLNRWAPADRANWTFAFCAAPGAGALILTVLCFLPSLDAPWWHLADHCSAHGNDHPHLCFTHLPTNQVTCAGLAALGLLGSVIVALAIDLARTTRLGRELRTALGHCNRAGDIESSQPLAATIGVLRPMVVISSTLRNHLREEFLAIVLAHEHAHVQRRDPLRRMVARLSSLFYLPPIRSLLLRDLHLACEQACDEEAANRSGDRLLVARALIAVERLLAGQQAALALPIGASAFGDTGITSRVNALTNDPVPRARLCLPVVSFGLLVALTTAADSIHHTTETLLGFIAR